MATFDYIKAVWRNGPGVVSDAPDWAIEAIERVLTRWMPGQGRDLVASHADAESGLLLRIFVSPSAMGSANLLEHAPHGSFVHVLASDRTNGDAGPDEAGGARVRRIFEARYGAPLSDAAVRQQRSFMLLEHPYHRELAVDLFVAKSAPQDGVETEPAGARTATDAHGEGEPERSGGELSLSFLLGGRAPATAEKTPDGLPFDQGLSYQEVLTKLANAVQPAQRPSPPAPARSPELAASIAPVPPGEIGRAAHPAVIYAPGFLEPPRLDRRRAAAGDVWAPIFAAAAFLFLASTLIGVLALMSPVAVEERRAVGEARPPAAVAPSEIAPTPQVVEAPVAKPAPVARETALERAKREIEAVAEPTPPVVVAVVPAAATSAQPGSVTVPAPAPRATSRAPEPVPSDRLAAAVEPGPEVVVERPHRSPAPAPLEPESASSLPGASGAGSPDTGVGSEAADASEADAAARAERETPPEVERRRRERRRLIQQIQGYR